MSNNVHDHMKEFAVASFGHALWHVIMTGRGATPWSAPFGLIHAVHGCELLIKAAIAQKNPLLIFKKIPASLVGLDSDESYGLLVKEGRTVQYSNLPDLLFRATGFNIASNAEYARVGELRNVVMHFSVPNEDYLTHVLSCLCNVADPILRKFWGAQIFDEIVDGWAEQDYYLFDDEPWIPNALDACGIVYDGWVPSPDNPRHERRKQRERER